MSDFPRILLSRNQFEEYLESLEQAYPTNEMFTYTPQRPEAPPRENVQALYRLSQRSELASLDVNDEGERSCIFCYHGVVVGDALADGRPANVNPETAVSLKKCGHAFGEYCLHKWLTTTDQALKCPICRAELVLPAPGRQTGDTAGSRRSRRAGRLQVPPPSPSHSESRNDHSPALTQRIPATPTLRGQNEAPAMHAANMLRRQQLLRENSALSALPAEPRRVVSAPPTPSFYYHDDGVEDTGIPSFPLTSLGSLQPQGQNMPTPFAEAFRMGDFTSHTQRQLEQGQRGQTIGTMRPISELGGNTNLGTPDVQRPQRPGNALPDPRSSRRDRLDQAMTNAMRQVIELGSNMARTISRAVIEMESNSIRIMGRLLREMDSEMNRMLRESEESDRREAEINAEQAEMDNELDRILRESEAQMNEDQADIQEAARQMSEFYRTSMQNVNRQAGEREGERGQENTRSNPHSNGCRRNRGTRP